MDTKLRDELYRAMENEISYWISKDITQDEVISGIVFSLLTLFDGDSANNNFKRYDLFYAGKNIRKGITELHADYTMRRIRGTYYE